MRNISHLKQRLQPLNGGGRPRQIQSALHEVNVGQSALRSGTNMILPTNVSFKTGGLMNG